MTTLILVSDKHGGNCLYIDGYRASSSTEETVYANQLFENAGEPIVLVYVDFEDGEWWPWPDLLTELIPEPEVEKGVPF